MRQIAMVAVIQVNLIWWLVMLSCEFSERMAERSKSVAITGFLFAAIAQHRAYRALQQASRAKEQPA